MRHVIGIKYGTCVYQLDMEMESWDQWIDLSGVLGSQDKYIDFPLFLYFFFINLDMLFLKFDIILLIYSK